MADSEKQFLVIDSNGKGHLPVRKSPDGPLDSTLMGAAWAALHAGYRGNKYQGPNKEQALKKLQALYKSEGMDLPADENSEIVNSESEHSPFTIHHSLLPRFVVTLDEPLSPSESLVRIPLAITGKWARGEQEFSITRRDLEDIVRNFSSRLNGEINVDYDHASEMPEVAAGGPIPSAGRIVKLDPPEEQKNGNRKSEVGNREEPYSLATLRQRADPPASGPTSYARFILWGWYEPTERARQLIAHREYRYISPALDWTTRNKRTGKSQGATLTSVALTNRPFLEELPPIRLSDPAYVPWDEPVRPAPSESSNLQSQIPNAQPSDAPVSSFDFRFSHSGALPDTRYPAPDTSQQVSNFQFPVSSSGGPMKPVTLSLVDGRIKIVHDDFKDEYVLEPEHARKCLEDLGLLAEAAPGGSGGVLTAAEQPAEISVAQATALLSEAEARGKSVPAVEVFRAQVERELDDATKAGKVLPRRRDDWRKIALADFPTFRKLMAEQKPQVPLRPVGFSGTGPEDVQLQVKLLAAERCRTRNISYGQALSEIGREQPELIAEYRKAVSAQ